MSQPEHGRPGRRALAGALVCFAAACAPACRNEARANKEPDAERTAAFLRTYADIAEAAYGDAAASAAHLLVAAKALAASPSAEALNAAREAWSRARVPYAQTETYRFYGGPIDRVETLVNTWPIDEEYIESSEGRPSIVSDAAKYPHLTKERLAALNMKEGETSVTTGFHAIEFLLWGKDGSPDGPGGRDASAFDPESALGPRRSAFLVAACELLVEHLQGVAAEWRTNPAGSYRGKLLGMPRREALSSVLKGMGALSGPELAGERLTVAYETKDQENEHSCFSDTTSADLAGNAAGVENVCLGRYSGTAGTLVHGPGLCDVIADVDPSLGARLKREIALGVSAARALPSPFDRALAGADTAPGRVAISAAIAALGAQAETLKLAASALGPSRPLAVR